MSGDGQGRAKKDGGVLGGEKRGVSWRRELVCGTYLFA